MLGKRSANQTGSLASCFLAYVSFIVVCLKGRGQGQVETDHSTIVVSGELGARPTLTLSHLQPRKVRGL